MKKTLGILFSFICICIFAFSVSVVGVSAASVTVGISVKGTTLETGKSLIVTVSAKDGRAPYKYKVDYKTGNSGWITAMDYGNETVTEIQLTTAGHMTIRASAKDASGLSASVTKEYDIEEKYTELTNESNASDIKAKLGTAITLTAAATGGKKPYTYSFAVESADSELTTVQDFSDSSSYSFKPSKPGYYTVYTYVRDSDNITVEKPFNIVVTQETGKPLVNTSSADTKVKAGGTANVSALATGGTAPYTYTVRYKNTSDEVYTDVVTESKSSKAAITFVRSGFYSIKVTVKDYDGRTAEKEIITASTEQTDRALINVSAPIISHKSLFNKGSGTVIKGQALGGTKPYKFAYSYSINGSDFKRVRDFSIDPDYNMTFDTIGKYIVRVEALDGNDKTACRYMTVNCVTPSYKSMEGGEILHTCVNYGRTISLTIPDAGDGAYYSFYYKKSDENVWQQLRGYSHNRNVTLRPRYLGNYIVRVFIDDGKKVRFGDYGYYTEIPDEVYEELALVNKNRKTAGLNPLVIDTELTFLANIRAEELAVSYGHNRPDGTLYDTIFSEYGAERSQLTLENIAEGYETVSDAMQAWMESEGHRDNIMNPDVTSIGIAINGIYWEQLFSDSIADSITQDEE